ncbi:hypothetical protein L1987_21795 [Smallanthus sonchifolius]|uniref:Uncharacterized protein n=1 Tax=Smallanthus sonchifolius TaxID=185202 RepID=A0ACB9IDM0_9ASTR|nr:hypothetical protein L1987_21795 [Smallanthus sonchifolius]
MASTTTTFFSILILLTYAATAATSQPPPSSSSTVCQYTPYPSFCQTSLPINNSSATIYDYGRLSIRKSISAASKFSNLIDKYLTNSASLTTEAIRALQDCRYLAGVNLEFLSTAFETLNTTQSILSDTKSEDIQTILSAILTNTETCIDGLQANAASWSSKNGIVAPIKDDNKLYSVSLALVNKGWGSKRSKKLHKHKGVKNGQLEAISESVGRRKLLQAGGSGNQVVVSQDGSGNFTTITDAVNFAPNNSAASAGYFVIYVKSGVYEEYVNIPKNKKYLMMVGDGINQTVITGNRSVIDGWTTFNSATFIVVSPNFVAVNLTIRNTAGAIKHQAVALRNGADLSTFYKCSFEGYQDTLYAHSLRQFYRECDVYGTVDFIFGNAAAVLQNCNLYPRLPMSGQFNAITAQGRTDPGQNTGTSIQKCNIRAADDLAENNGTTVTYLGRPWKEYSRTVYMQSFMDSLIAPAGWSVWSGDFALNTSYYAEFNNSGLGSDTSRRVTWLGFHIINETDAVNFTVSAFISGDAFLPQTGVPYDGGSPEYSRIIFLKDVDLSMWDYSIKGTAIQANVLKRWFPLFEHLLKDSGCYFTVKPTIGRNNSRNKYVANDNKIGIYSDSKVYLYIIGFVGDFGEVKNIKTSTGQTSCNCCYSRVDTTRNILAGDKGLYPDEFSKLLEKKFVFKIDITEFNIDNNHWFFGISKLTSELKKKANNYESGNSESITNTLTEIPSQETLNFKASLESTDDNVTPLSQTEQGDGKRHVGNV